MLFVLKWLYVLSMILMHLNVFASTISRPVLQEFCFVTGFRGGQFHIISICIWKRAKLHFGRYSETKHNLETWPFDSQQFLICLMLSCSFWVVDSGILRWDANDSDDCWRCANGKSYLVFDVSQTGSNNLGKRSFFLRVLYLWFTDSTGLVSCLCGLFDWKIVHLLEFCWGEALLVQATMWRSFNLLWLQMMYWMSIGVSP